MEKINKPKRNNETSIEEKIELTSKEERVQKSLIQKIKGNQKRFSRV